MLERGDWVRALRGPIVLDPSMFPNGATVMYLQGQSGASPAFERSNGLHNVLDKARDKYKFVFEDTATSIAPKACR